MHPLIEEAMKKAAIVWLTVADARPYGVWCLWTDGALYLVSGPGEQPAPGLAEATEALVTARGDHGGRIVYSDSPSPGSSPEATSHTPNPSADEPLAGSSRTPRSGANTRVCAMRVSGSQAKTLTSPPPAGVPTARATASGRTDRYGQSRPQPAIRGAGPAKSSAARPAEASSGAGSSSGPTVGVPPVSVAAPSSCTKIGSSPAPHSCTTSPAPVPVRRA